MDFSHGLNFLYLIHNTTVTDTAADALHDKPHKHILCCIWSIYLDGVGVAGVRGAGGRVVDGVSSVAAGLVGRKPEQRPVALFEPERVLLGTGEVVLALHGQAPQGLGVQPPQLGVDALPVVNVAQEGLQLQAGAHIGCQARFWS